MSKPRTEPTVFPYTTLFRSSATATRGSAPSARGCAHSTFDASFFKRLDEALGIVLGAQGVIRERLATIRRDALQGDAGDRKSTRLNSSHSQISYAVFCLKKK